MAYLGINIGVPVPVYAAPPPVYAPPAAVYAPAVVPGLAIGWHNGWYWDGHRYWSRRDWYARGHHGYR
jgi:hypothetical protein